MSLQQQTFASKMQELIDEHREDLSTEFVRVSMEACQKEYNNPTNFVFVRCYLRILDTYCEGCDCGCGECMPKQPARISVQKTRRITRLDLTAFEKVKAHISEHGDMDLSEGRFVEGIELFDVYVQWFTKQALEDMGLTEQQRDATSVVMIEMI